MTRQQLQPYKSELRTVFNRVCALVEKRTSELAQVRAERDDALERLMIYRVACGAMALGIGALIAAALP